MHARTQPHACTHPPASHATPSPFSLLPSRLTCRHGPQGDGLQPCELEFGKPGGKPGGKPDAERPSLPLAVLYAAECAAARLEKQLHPRCGRPAQCEALAAVLGLGLGSQNRSQRDPERPSALPHRCARCRTVKPMVCGLSLHGQRRGVRARGGLARLRSNEPPVPLAEGLLAGTSPNRLWPHLS
jgi:hypothetical protein